MKVRVVAGLAVAAFVTGIAVGALADTHTYTGSSLESQAVTVDAGTTFDLTDADFNLAKIAVPNYVMSFTVSSLTLYTLEDTPLGSVELTAAVGCDTAPPIGTRIVMASAYKAPSGPVTTLPDPLVDPGTYTITVKIDGKHSHLGNYNCDTLTFSTDASMVSMLRYPLTSS